MLGDGEDEAVIVRGADRIAAAQFAEAAGHDAGEGVICGASDEGVEEVMAWAGGRDRGLRRNVGVLDEFLDQEGALEGDLGEAMLGGEHGVDDAGIGSATCQAAGDPSEEGLFRYVRFQAFPDFAAEA